MIGIEDLVIENVVLVEIGIEDLVETETEDTVETETEALAVIEIEVTVVKGPAGAMVLTETVGIEMMEVGLVPVKCLCQFC